MVHYTHDLQRKRLVGIVQRFTGFSIIDDLND